MPTQLVRFAFVVLAFAGGLGIALYGAYWIVLPTAPGRRPRPAAAAGSSTSLAAVAAWSRSASPAQSLPGRRAVPADPARLPRRRADLAAGLRPDRADARAVARPRSTRPAASGSVGCASPPGRAGRGRRRARAGPRRLHRRPGRAARDGGHGHRPRAGHRPVVDADGDAALRRSARAIRSRSAPTSPRTCTTRCCRRSPSSSATPTRRVRWPGWPADRNASCGPCSTATARRPGQFADAAAHGRGRGRGRVRDHGRRRARRRRRR